jgi:hypothetical protein
MKTLTAFSKSDVSRIVSTIREQTSAMQTTQEAAQRITEVLFRELGQSLALVRFYLTVPFQALPHSNRAFVGALAQDKGVAPMLRSDTLVLSLLETSGVEPEWNHYERSKGHIGIPLVGADFVESIPMTSRLLGDLGVALLFFDTRSQGVASEVSAGAIGGTFFVSDAATTCDDKGRWVIAAESFVDQYAIRTVFGLGGTYLSPDDLLAVILFTRESLTREQVQPFESLLTGIKASTARTVLRKQIFRA